MDFLLLLMNHILVGHRKLLSRLYRASRIQIHHVGIQVRGHCILLLLLVFVVLFVTETLYLHHASMVLVACS